MTGVVERLQTGHYKERFAEHPLAVRWYVVDLSHGLERRDTDMILCFSFAVFY